MTDFGVRCRFAAGILMLALALAGLGVRLGFLHLGAHAEVRAGLAGPRSMRQKIDAPRGTIYDCRGRRNILALDLAAKDVCADPRFLARSNITQEVSAALASELGLRAEAVREALGNPERRFAYVRRYVPEDQLVALRARNLPGVFFEDSTVRFYPHLGFMCHVLGFVNYERTGSAGVEQVMDRYLRGSPGILESQVDAFRHELYTRRSRDIPALRGADVFLTVDQNVQYIVERELDAAVAEHRARGAWAIMQRVRTGEILAMAARPAYDLNEFRTAEDVCRLNRAIGHVYEPGSTMKLVTFAAALNEGTVSPETIFDCENGAWSHAGHVLHDFHAYGRLSVADGLQKSSNILAAKLALTLGDRRLHAYLDAFNVGRPLGIDLPGEEGGLLLPAARWSNVSASRIAIGQGVAVTALQMMGILGAIANNGFLMRPHVVARVEQEEGLPLLRREPQAIGRPIRPETAALMRRLLTRVTEEGGTGRRARVEGYAVAGKTGTAQKAAGGRYIDKYVASFVGFLPANDPEIALIVVVDEPEPEHTGGVVAAPVFARIAARAVRCLDMPSPAADKTVCYAEPRR
ncbi:MAG: penicillin-binding protein 2 [Lentisphaerae bacterium]|nr:penicillin-binding protein 2 [Lentisphaerota bacterium]